MITLQIDQAQTDFLGVDFFHADNFWKLTFRFAINIIWIFLIARLLYYPKQRKPEYLFSYCLIGSVVFIVCSLLKSVTLTTGFAVGLFAIFAVLRYRTNPIPVKEMTYFFIIIGISVADSLGEKASYVELLFCDGAIFLMAFAGEYFLFRKKYYRKTIIIQNIELTRPENYTKLLEELTALSGYKIEKAEIGRVDYIKKQARIRIFYHAKDVPAVFNDDGDNDD
jgi:hypothetical protein